MCFCSLKMQVVERGPTPASNGKKYQITYANSSILSEKLENYMFSITFPIQVWGCGALLKRTKILDFRKIGSAGVPCPAPERQRSRKTPTLKDRANAPRGQTDPERQTRHQRRNNPERLINLRGSIRHTPIYIYIFPLKAMATHTHTYYVLVAVASSCHSTIMP